MWKSVRKILVVGASTLIVAAITLNSDTILQTLITPLPKDIQGCLSAKFSQSVEAQQACTNIANVNSVAVWQQTGGNFVLRESGVYEDFANTRLGVGVSNPAFGIDISKATGNEIVSRRNGGSGAVMQGLVGSDVGFDRAFFGHNAVWNGTTWTLRNIGANDAQGILIDNGGGMRFIQFTNTGSTQRDLTHTQFEAGTQMYLANTGNLGIGTTSPGWQLSVAGDAGIGSNVNSGSALDVGSSAVDYPANSGWAGTWTSNILLNGLNSTSISFHDSGDSVGVLRYTDNEFYLGEATSWGTSGLTVGDNVNAQNFTVRAGNANTGGTIGPSTSTWTPYDVSGSTGGYAGFNFTSEGIRLMMDSTYQGVHGPSGWLWYWDNGTLASGTVPAARVSGTVSSASYATSAGSASSVNGYVTNQHTRTSDTLQFSRLGVNRNPSSYQFEVSGTSWLIGYTCMGNSCSPGYESQASAQSSNNFLIWGMSWTGLGFKMGSTVDSWARMVQANNWGAYHNVAMGALFANGATRFDIAEFTPVDPSEKLMLGELVMPNPAKGMQLVRTKSAYAPGMAGIVSNVNTASMVIGGDTTPEKAGIVEDKKPIALGGRVITIVNLEGGTISQGEAITSSSTPGTGMKATQGQFVSKAMESFDGSQVNSPGVEEILANLRKERSKDPLTEEEKQSLDNAIADITAPLPEGTGRIITFVTQGYTDIESLEGVQVAKDGSVTKGTSTIQAIAAYAQAVIGKLKVGVLETQKLIVNGVDMGKKVQDLETELQTQKKINQAQDEQIKKLEERLEKLEK